MAACAGSAMIPVIISWYPRGGEVTATAMMPQVPAIGESLRWPTEPAECGHTVKFVTWVAVVHEGEISWHAEISVGHP